jgi:hypothetical protein
LFVSEKTPLRGSSKQVTYKITAVTSVAVDAKTVKASVRPTLAKLQAGISLLSSQQQQAFDSSSENIDISANNALQNSVTNKVLQNSVTSSPSKNFALGLAPGSGAGMGMGMGLLGGNFHKKGNSSKSREDLCRVEKVFFSQKLKNPIKLKDKKKSKIIVFSEMAEKLFFLSSSEHNIVLANEN